MGDHRTAGLLNLIAGHDTPVSGTVPQSGADYLAKRKRVGPITSIDTLVASGMIGPGLATQIVRIPE